ERIGTLHGWMTCPATNDENGDVDGSQRRRRQRETICARPIEDVDPGRRHGVGTDALRPGSKCAGAAVKVDHLCDRLQVPTLESGEIRLRHAAKFAIELVLPGVTQYFGCRRLEDHETCQGYLLAERHSQRDQAAEGMTDQLDA